MDTLRGQPSGLRMTEIIHHKIYIIKEIFHHV